MTRSIVSQVVYAYYPKGLRTGGPEAVHQLVDSLRRQGREAYLVPFPETPDAEPVEAFSVFDCPEAREPPIMTMRSSSSQRCGSPCLAASSGSRARSGGSALTTARIFVT